MKPTTKGNKKMTMQEKIVQMQTKKKEKPEVYKADDGTWGHCMAFNAGFSSKIAAQMDLRFCKDWEK